MRMWREAHLAGLPELRRCHKPPRRANRASHTVRCLLGDLPDSVDAGAVVADVVLHRRLGGVRQRLALAGRHRDVRAHLARGLRLAAGAPANVQLVVAREQHLHHAQVRHRVALVQRAAAQLEEADVVVQRVAPHLEAQVAGAIVAPLEGLGVALGRVDVEWLDELLAALAAARVGRRHRELDVVSQGRIKVERIRLVALAEIGADARWDLSEGLAKRWDGRLAGTR
mmetsp:Transcript_14802/g.42458  ORF Transcript_14802/g.42458 Transcript_14802/m.42458 type:complete len:227 (+) Transcript_14802:462-1142(+)